MMYPGVQLRVINERVGSGVCAVSLIRRGTVVWVLDELDQVLSPARVAAMPDLLRKQVERYGYLNADGDHVLCWDHGRFVNHSCAPATASVGMTMEVARRDILPGEEITCEYAFSQVIERFECQCGAPECVRTLAPVEHETPWKRWDEDAAAAFEAALGVPQPLLAAARPDGPDAWIVQAIRERRRVTLPSWANWRIPSAR